MNQKLLNIMSKERFISANCDFEYIKTESLFNHTLLYINDDEMSKFIKEAYYVDIHLEYGFCYELQFRDKDNTRYLRVDIEFQDGQYVLIDFFWRNV